MDGHALSLWISHLENHTECGLMCLAPFAPHRGLKAAHNVACVRTWLNKMPQMGVWEAGLVTNVLAIKHKDVCTPVSI